MKTTRKKRQVKLEQYFTTDTLVRKCLSALESHYPLSSFDLIVEPGAGDGAFLAALPTKKTVAMDIDPRHPSVVYGDFLSWSPPQVAKPQRILSIGNPPFGQRAALAVKFLERACGFSDVVAFILPRIFRKHTFRSRVNKQFHCVHEFDCGEFRLPDGSDFTVKCVFQVWERRAEPREDVQLDTKHPDFDLKHAHLSRITPAQFSELCKRYDFALPQVGTKFKPCDHTKLTAGSHWFVRANCKGVRDVFERLDFKFLANTNTTFTSLSKKDIILAYKAAKKIVNKKTLL